jgi:hypothetical protein
LRLGRLVNRTKGTFTPALSLSTGGEQEENHPIADNNATAAVISGIFTRNRVSI